MLFVSVAARSAARSVVAGRLVELGAVRGRTPPARPRPDHDVNVYSKDKMPWISAALARAESWAQSTAWSPSP